MGRNKEDSIPSHAACGLSKPLSLFGKLSAITGIKNEDLGNMTTKANKNSECEKRRGGYATGRTLGSGALAMAAAASDEAIEVVVVEVGALSEVVTTVLGLTVRVRRVVIAHDNVAR